MKAIKNSGNVAWIFISIFLFVSAFTLNAKKQDRNVKDFDKISFSISGDLYVTQGSTYSVQIEASDKDLEKLVTEVDGNTLKIKTKPGSWKLKDVKVWVTTPNLSAIYLSGSGNAIAGKTIKSEKMKLSVSGSGDIQFKDLQVSKANVSIAGSGDVELSGKCTDDLKISVAGSGNVKAADFEADNVEVDISGSGSAKVFAIDKLESDIVGSGSVYYKGKPLIDANTVGSGSTKAL